MKFSDVLSDITALIGLRLSSIKEGAEITLLNVDPAAGHIRLMTATGVRRTQPLWKIRKVWKELCGSPAIHVDAVLDGSGPSRNQPETIMANLPYVEWLRHDRRKYIALVGRHSHPLGSVRQMDEVAAESLREELRDSSLKTKALALIVTTRDLGALVSQLESITGLPVVPVVEGVYSHESNGITMLLVASGKVPLDLKDGVYPVLQSPFPLQGNRTVVLGNWTFYCGVIADQPVFIHGRVRAR